MEFSGKPLNRLPPPPAPAVLPERLRKETFQASHIQDSGIYYYFAESQRIGRGAYSEVFRGYYQTPETKAAVKCVEFEDERSVRDCENELSIWKTIQETEDNRKQYIVHFFNFAVEVNRVYIAMELADQTLKQMMVYDRNDDPMCSPGHPRTRIRVGGDFMRNVATGLEFLHSLDIVHRDIKPENILIFKNPITGLKIAKLGDFGLSRELSESQGSFSMAKGTPIWMAPEALESLSHVTTFLSTKAVDVFSLGMVCFYSINFSHPFQVNGDVIRNIRDPDYKPKWFGTRARNCADHLLCWMMQKDPEKRPTIQQCRKHPYFWDNQEEMSLQFMKDVINTVVNPLNPQEWKEPRVVELSLDVTYAWWLKTQFKEIFSWNKAKGLEPILMSSTTPDKTNSVLSLFQFIVDTVENPNEKCKEMFARDGEFCKKECVQFFLETFPDAVVIVFCLLVTVSTRFAFLESMKIKYFDKLIGSEVNWTDSSVVRSIPFFLSKVDEFERLSKKIIIPGEGSEYLLVHPFTM